MLASKSRPCGGRVCGSEDDGRGWSAGEGGGWGTVSDDGERASGETKKKHISEPPCHMKKPGEPGGAPIFFLTRSWEFRAGRSSRARTLGGCPARVRASVRGALCKLILSPLKRFRMGAAPPSARRSASSLSSSSSVASRGTERALLMISRRGAACASRPRWYPRAPSSEARAGRCGRRAAPSREARVPRVARLGRVDPERSRASEGPGPREDVAKRVGHRRSASFRCSSPSDQA